MALHECILGLHDHVLGRTELYSPSGIYQGPCGIMGVVRPALYRVNLLSQEDCFKMKSANSVGYTLPMPLYHITQPDQWDRACQTSLCGSRDPMLVAWDRVLRLLADRSLKREEICESCWIEFERRTAKA